MTVETATYISDLNTSNPAASDNRSEGDDHLRLIKATIKTTFPNVNGAMNATDEELNRVVGVTSAIQTQIDAKAPIASPTLTGTTTASALSVSGAATVSGLLTAQAGITVSGGAVSLSGASSVVAPTPTTGDDSTKVATTEFVNDVAMNSALPSQSAAIASYTITSSGSVASWTPNAGQMLYLAENYT